MRKLITQLLKVIPLLAVMLTFTVAKAQQYSPTAIDDFNYTIRNFVQTSASSFEFDLFLLDTDASQPMELASLQAGINVNSNIYNGGTLTATIITGYSQLPLAMQPTSVQFTQSVNIIKLAGKTPPGAGNGPIISTVSPGTNISHIKVQNTANFTSCSTCDLTFTSSTAVSPSYATRVATYISGLNTQLTVTPGVNANNLTGNPALNCAPTGYNVTGSGAYCASGTGLTVTLSNSDLGINYQLYQNTVVSGAPLAGIGAALTWANETAGTYTVVATNPSTLLSTTMTGSAIITMDPLSVGGTIAPPTTTITLGQSTGTLTLSGKTGAVVKWQKQFNGGGFTDIAATAGLLTYSETPAAVGTYDYQAVVQSGTCGTATSAQAHVTVNPAGPVLPTVVTNAATAVTAISATLNGTVTAGNATTTVTFDWGPIIPYANTGIAATPPTVSGTTATPVSTNITGLISGTTYHFRCNGVNSAGTTNGNDMTFVATACPLPADAGAVTGPANVCLTGTGYVYTVPVIANATGYTWTLPTGFSITAGANTNSITVSVSGSAVAGNVSVYGINVCGQGAASNRAVTVNALPVPIITGPASVCVNSTGNIYTTQAGMSGYTWTVSAGGAITAGGATNAITVTWSTAGAKTVTVVYTNAAGCTAAAPSSYAVTVNALPVPTISGPASSCVNSTTNVYTTQTGMSGYTWTVSAGGTITAGAGTSSITVTWTVAGSQTVTVNYTNASLCTGAAPVSYAVTVNLLPIPTIGGPATACVNSTGNVYTTQASMTGYTWTISAGGTITAGAGTNSITVKWNTVGTQTVTINYANANGCTAAAPTSLTVTVVALPVPTITGPANACSGTTSNVYTTQTGMSGYAWTVSAGGTITAGGTTSSITVTWNTAGAQSVTVNYTNASGCTAVAATSYPVTVSLMTTPTITGTNNLCINSGFYDYVTQTGMTNYVWTVSGGGTITFGAGTNDIQVTWNAPGTQNVSVNYTNPSGCSAGTATNFAVTVNPMPGPAGAITGTSTVCGGTNGVAYSTTSVVNATSYVWNLPAGATIATGAGTRNITVNFAGNASSGNIIAYGNNVCGNGAPSASYAVTVNPLPAVAGTITGSTSVCEGTNGVAYSVSTITGSTSYVWTVPAGVNIVSGANTASIVVNFTPAAVSGDITVHGTNTCGAGGTSPALTVTVNQIPSTPTITANLNVLTSSASAGNKWYMDGTAISGATGQTYTALHTGHYWTQVTVNNCISDTSNHIYILFTGINNLQSSDIEIYPVPNDGKFNVSITSPAVAKFNIVVYNGLGSSIYEEQGVEVNNGKLDKVIDLRPIPDGVYTVVFRNSENQIVKKIIVNK
jgi:hypothetical protein